MEGKREREVFAKLDNNCVWSTRFTHYTLCSPCLPACLQLETAHRIRKNKIKRQREEAAAWMRETVKEKREVFEKRRRALLDLHHAATLGKKHSASAIEVWTAHVEAEKKVAKQAHAHAQHEALRWLERCAVNAREQDEAQSFLRSIATAGQAKEAPPVRRGMRLPGLGYAMVTVNASEGTVIVQAQPITSEEEGGVAVLAGGRPLRLLVSTDDAGVADMEPGAMAEAVLPRLWWNRDAHRIELKDAVVDVNEEEEEAVS